MSAATSQTISAVDLAAACVDQQKRLLADAKRLDADALDAREEAYFAVSKAERAETAALQASAAARDDAELAAALGLRRAQLEHARADLRAATQKSEAASLRVKETSARLEIAERALEAARIEEELAEPGHEAASAADVDLMVSSVIAIRDALLRHRARLERDAAAVRRLHEVGGPVAVRARDGTSAAGALARALIAAGGRMHLTNPAEFRWLFDLPQATSPTLSPIAATSRLVDLVLGALGQGERDLKAGFADRGLSALEEMAQVWTRSRTYQDAREATGARDAAAVHAKADADREAHERRLEAVRQRQAAKRGRAVDARGRVIGPPNDPPRPPAPDQAGLDDVRPPKPRPPASVVAAVQPDLMPGEFVLPGSAEAPGGNPWPTTPDTATPRAARPPLRVLGGQREVAGGFVLPDSADADERAEDPVG